MTVRQQRRPAVRRVAQLGLMPVGVLAVHQLRYWLAFGSHAGVILRAQGHSYLHSLAPWIVLLLAVSVGVFLRALGRAFGGRSSVSGHTISFFGLWLVCAFALVGIYCGQEFLEGLFATGHPTGLIGIFGYGGLWSIPAALAVGLVLAAAFYGATWVIREVAERCARGLPKTSRRQTLQARARDAFLLRPAPLAEGWSGRGPPS